MPITAFYAALLALLFILLSVRVIAQRREARVEIGHGDSYQLLRRMRVHANFAEYVPFALLLMALAESLKAPSLFLHLLGLALLAGRLIHAYGLSQTPHILRLRVLGMMLTFTVIGIAAALAFLLAGVQLIV
jgi:uncharacterized membrane protein YecN with MAPEG domain